MNTIQVVALVLLLLTVLFAVVTIMLVVRSKDGAAATVGITTAVCFLALLVAGWMAVMPEYRLYKASVEKRILVEQANAEADAAEEQARAEIERAKGTAESNEIVDASITEAYLRYLWIDNISETDNQIIYVPSDNGLPILEAGKR